MLGGSSSLVTLLLLSLLFLFAFEVFHIVENLVLEILLRFLVELDKGRIVPPISIFVDPRLKLLLVLLSDVLFKVLPLVKSGRKGCFIETEVVASTDGWLVPHFDVISHQ